MISTWLMTYSYISQYGQLKVLSSYDISTMLGSTYIYIVNTPEVWANDSQV